MEKVKEKWKNHTTVVSRQKKTMFLELATALIEYFPKGFVPLDRNGSTLTQMRRLTI